MFAPKDLKIGDVFTDEFGEKFKVTEILPRIGYNVVKITDSNVKTTPQKEKETSSDLEDKGIKELQEMCREKGLSIRGTKADVIERLRSN